MLSVIRCRLHGLKELFPTSRCRFPLVGYYSTNTSPSAAADSTNQTHFMVNFLINSVGLSTEEAISASTKVSHLKSTKNADLVLDTFSRYGLDKTQIRNIVFSVPKVLLRKAGKTLEPKLRVLRELGLSESDLVKLIKKDPNLFARGLNTAIVPTINILRDVVGSDENVVHAINKSGWFLSTHNLRFIRLNVAFLRSYGVSNELIGKFIVRTSRWILQKPEILKDVVGRVEIELGIPRDSKMFLHGVVALSSRSRSKLQMVFAIFRSFGWSDSDISMLARRQPICFTQSEAKIRNVLNFFMKELGYPPAFLATSACLLTYSLENRVRPRNEVLKLLKEKKLMKSLPSLRTVATYSETTFLRFMLRYKSEIPDLVETYSASKRDKLEIKYLVL